MPKNNNLEPVKLPMNVRFNENPITEFKNNLEAIHVQLIGAPTMDELRNYMVPFLNATWAESPLEGSELSLSKKDKLIRECFEGKALPTALETVNLVFCISGISLQEVTHILRYRNASFSADCSGDKWWSHKPALVPTSIQQSNGTNNWVPQLTESGQVVNREDFYARYQQIVKDAKQLYCDMIDSKQISIMDARYILPRCLETFYYMRISIKDALGFIRARIDKQIQPETDNLIAYHMWLDLLMQFPILNGLIDIHHQSDFYIKMARTGKATNLYFPDEDSDKFMWNENDFIYQCKRDELNGTDEDAANYFDIILGRVDETIKQVERSNAKKLFAEYESNNEIVDFKALSFLNVR